MLEVNEVVGFQWSGRSLLDVDVAACQVIFYI